MTGSVRSRVKGVVEAMLSRGYSSTLGSRVMAGRTLVLAYHNVLPDDTDLRGDMSLHMPRPTFAEHLDLLMERCDVIPLEQMQAEPRSSARPRVVVTFDDAYFGAVNLGIAELTRRRLPATIFVAPGLLGQSSLWWDELAAGLSSGEFEAYRAGWLAELEGDSDRIREAAAALRTASALRIDCVRTATEDELAWAAQQPGITVAAHSWSHPNLSRVSPQRLQQELRTPLDWLQSRYRSFIPWLAYPYGLYSADVVQQAMRAGYRGAFAGGGGWMPRKPRAMHELPRLNVPRGLTLDGFAVKLGGLFC